MGVAAAAAAAAVVDAVVGPPLCVGSAGIRCRFKWAGLQGGEYLVCSSNWFAGNP